MNDNRTLLFSEWQEQFCHSLLSDLSENLKTTFSQDSAEKRFNIYQNNVFYSLTNALGDLYPVIKKLVGDDFFTGTAAYYLRQNPPQQAAMVNFGKDFPEFLQSFEHTQEMPYLTDVARLELAWHQAYHAMDVDSLPPENFSELSPESLSDTCVEFHPSLQLLESAYPIFSIWQANQDGQTTENTINLNEPQQVLIVRPLYEVLIFNIDIGTRNFLSSLLQKQTIEAAIEESIENTENADEFDISSAIQLLIQSQLATKLIKRNS